MSHDEPAHDDPSGAPGDGSSRRAGTTRVRRRRRGLRRWVILGVFALVVVAGVTLALMARPLISARHEALAAQSDLTHAKAALDRQDYHAAAASVREARAHVDRASSDVNGTSGDVWSVVPVAGTAVHDERHLVAALDQATSVADLGVQLYPMVSGDSATLIHGDRVDLATLQEVADRLTAIGPHLDAALADLGQVKGSTPLVGGSIHRATTRALDYLDPLQESYQDNAPLLQAMPSMLGADGPRTYLLAMLNPSEQRYSGGATLTFTTLRADRGVLTFGQTQNADDLLSQGTYQSWPPVPGNTFHRTRAPQRVTNATFSPWWSVSGEELLRAYGKAFPGPRLNGLIGIDLQGLADLFQVTGPVSVPGVGRVGAGNLVKVLAGSYDRFPTIQARRQVNAALVPLFRDRFLEGGHIQAKASALVKSAAGRHFFTYFRSDHLQRRFARVGLSGNLSATPNDYVGVFSQNLNGSKVDYWQHRDVTSTVRLQADGTAKVHLHVAVTNASPPYSGVGPDPGVGYFTRLLGTRIGVFMPRNATYESTMLDGKPYDATLHLPKVVGVRNRKYVEGTLTLPRGHTGTMDVDYSAPNAAEVDSSGALVYRLSVDPQDLVVPETLHVHVTWPAGYRPSGALPAGWRASAGGATYAGPVAVMGDWEIPLTHG